MLAVHEIPNCRLRNADAARKCGLGRLSASQVLSKGLHMEAEDIGLPYRLSIGGSYPALGDYLPMPRTRTRTFLERALEALRERHPRERPTQTRLAKIAGVSQPAVFEWGLPDRAPAHPQVLKLARELNVCVEWLYTERGPKHPQKAADSPEPFLQTWENLDPETKRQLERYAEFIKGESPRQQ
jgi:hypothetical protein